MPFPKSIAAAVVLALIAGCTTIAGLGGDYEVGDIGSDGGASSSGGAGPGSGASGPSAGGGAAGPGSGGSGVGGMAGGAGPGSGGNGGVVGTGGGGGAGGALVSDLVVTCDGATCGAGQICCALANVPLGANTQQACADPGTCAGADFQIECNGPEDCNGGLICCGLRELGSYYNGVTCRAAAACSGGSYAVFCGDNGSANQALCVNGGTCQASADLTDYFYCAGD